MRLRNFIGDDSNDKLHLDIALACRLVAASLSEMTHRASRIFPVVYTEWHPLLLVLFPCRWFSYGSVVWSWQLACKHFIVSRGDFVRWTCHFSWPWNVHNLNADSSVPNHRKALSPATWDSRQQTGNPSAHWRIQAKHRIIKMRLLRDLLTGRDDRRRTEPPG